MLETNTVVVQYNMTKESVSIYQERVEMSKTIAAAVEKKAAAAEKASTGCVIYFKFLPCCALSPCKDGFPECQDRAP